MIVLQAMLAVALLQAPDSTRVTGHWQFNAQESDNPRTQMSRDSAGGGERGQGQGDGGGYRGRRGGGGGGGGEFGGGGGREGGMESRGREGGGGGGFPMSAQDRAARQNLFMLALRPAEELDLVESDTSLLVVGANGDSVLLLTNGHKLERRLDENQKIEYRARRRDGRLEVERQVGNAGKITETYYMSPRGGQLFVLVHVQPASGRGELTFRRIYDPATSP